MAEVVDRNEFLRSFEVLVRQGRLLAAEATCKTLLERDQNDEEAWHCLGIVTLQSARFDEAEAAFRNAIALAPDRAEYWSNLGIALHRAGRFSEAEASSRRAVEIDPSRCDYWLNLGSCLAGEHRWREASEVYKQAVNCDPLNALAWNCFGTSEQRMGRLSDAQAAYECSLAILPGYSVALVNIAYLLAERGDPTRAIEILRNVLSQDDRLFAGWDALGNAYRLLSNWTEAVRAFRKALDLAPQHEEARLNLALVLLQQNLSYDAESVLRPSLTVSSGWAPAWAMLGSIQQMQFRSDEAARAFQRSIEIDPDPHRHSSMLLNTQYLEGQDAPHLLKTHREWDELYADKIVRIPTTMRARSADDQLRVGFVSAEFGRHPIAFLALRALECIDQKQCRVMCYSDRLIEDEYTARFRAASVWRKTAGLNADELADQIHRDEVDVLVDLMGHTGKRLLTFARKPAPIQVTWLGYVGTTGLAAMDFLLADRFHVREGEEGWYAERVLHMPNGYACYAPPADAPDVSPLPAASTRQVTFGCFNNLAKYTTTTLDTWSSILRRLPTSRLLLKYGGFDQPQLQERLLAKFDRLGIERNRISMEGWSPPRDHLTAYNRVDIALDTQPYSGGLTTCEALWMGVPVITWPGRTFAGRHSVSHLSNAGYPQFIAADRDAYVELAVEWAIRLPELAALRAEMRERVRQSPLCDAPRFATDLLAVLRQAWDARVVAPDIDAV